MCGPIFPEIKGWENCQLLTKTMMMMMMMMMNFIHVSMYLADANWGEHKDKINNE